MRYDCHIHMILDGQDWRAAIDRHRAAPEESFIRRVLESYAREGFVYLRDGGDRWGAGKRARELAPEYGITYRTPLAPLCRRGHYGAFIGLTYENYREYRELINHQRSEGADFVKIMISGLMDFDRYGVLTDIPREEEEIRELIHIAHEEGFSVMVHANGARTVEAAARGEWTLWNTVPTWTLTPSMPCGKTALSGFLPCPPSAISGEKAGLTKPLCGRSWTAR